MKIKWGALVVDGRNKIGGQVASKNRAGAYMRNKVTPVNPGSTYQVAVRSRLSSISASWRGLTAAQRLAWNAAVSDFKKTDIFGDIQNPSGFNLYQKLNNNLSNVGGAALVAPNSPVSVSVFATVALTAVEGGAITLTVTPTTLPVTERLIVRATAPQSAGKSFVKSEFRQITVLSAIVAGSVVLTTQYTAKFGAVLENQKIFLELIHVSTTTGQASLAQQVSAIVTA